MIGQTLSHYRILAPLGAGGMGVVYLAEDQRLGRQVALKFLPRESDQDHQALERFRLEARTASSLSHPGICAIYDIGMHDDAPYIVMELLKGETMRERVARGPFKIVDVLDMGIQLADALGAAHAQGIVHRDIKPANIFVGEKLRVKILDFGLAKLAQEHPGLSTGARADTTTANIVTAARPRLPNQLTAPGTAIGTVSYMSPEQARGEDVDARTDIFSLGVVLYEMVTGRQAFGGSTSAVVFDYILNRAPVSAVLLNPETPQRLVDVINTALEKDRDMRYARASELEADLKRVRRDLQSGPMASAHTMAAVAAHASAPTTVAAAPVSPTAATRVPASGSALAAAAAATRHRRPWYLLGAVAVAAAGGLALWNTTRPRSPSEAIPVAVTNGDASEPLRRARLRLAARDLRAALAEAAAAVQHDPRNADAVRLRDDLGAQVDVLDGLLATARQALAAGDTVAATRALADAQSRAPGDGEVAVMAAAIHAATPAATTVTSATPAGAASRRTPPAPVLGPTPSARGALAEALRTAPAVPQPAPEPIRTAPPVATTTGPTAIPPPIVVPAAPEPAPPPPAAPPSAPPAKPEPVVVTRSSPVTPPPTAATAEGDAAAVRRAIDTYKRAIESKDVALFRAVRPDLSADEEKRLRTSFEQVTRQQIDIRIENLAITGDTAVARLARRDVVELGGRTQTSQTVQTLRLARRGSGWIIVGLGR